MPSQAAALEAALPSCNLDSLKNSRQVHCMSTYLHNSIDIVRQEIVCPSSQWPCFEHVLLYPLLL